MANKKRLLLKLTNKKQFLLKGCYKKASQKNVIKKCSKVDFLKLKLDFLLLLIIYLKMNFLLKFRLFGVKNF